ncbi:MAG: hypothetical protein IT464_06410 [Planctomycetes bacterium]|nr:hypothetical protein [Planctomycetota bacterium]
MNSQGWSRVGLPLKELDAEFLRDLIHCAGYPARLERLTIPAEIEHGRDWCTLVRHEDLDVAIAIRDRNFDGPTRRPTKRWRLTGLLRRRKPAA